jgi:autotransporter adhesin
MVSNRSKAFSADCRSPREGADGDASVAVGDASVAVGDASVAVGDASVAVGEVAVAVGEVAVAVGEVAAVDALGVLGSRPGWEVCIL